MPERGNAVSTSYANECLTSPVTVAELAQVCGEKAPGISPRVLESSPVHEGEEATAYDAMVRRHAWLLNRPFVAMLSRNANTVKLCWATESGRSQAE